MLFSNFTEKARIAISEAHDAAAEMGHNYIGSEHLLMGLIREGSGVAAKVLEKNGVTVEKVKDKIEWPEIDILFAPHHGSVMKNRIYTYHIAFMDLRCKINLCRDTTKQKTK